MFKDFSLINSEAQVVYFLGLSEKVIPNLVSSKNYETLRKALDRCWDWLEHKNIDADDLYWYFENLDDTGVITLMQFEEDDYKLKIWICVADAIAFTIRQAYICQKDEYLPATIEAVDIEETINEFNTNFDAILDAKKDNKSKDILLDYLIENYPNSINDGPTKEEIIKILS